MKVISDVPTYKSSTESPQQTRSPSARTQHLNKINLASLPLDQRNLDVSAQCPPGYYSFLPREIWSLILNFLPVHTLLKFSLVSKSTIQLVYKMNLANNRILKEIVFDSRWASKNITLCKAFAVINFKEIQALEHAFNTQINLSLDEFIVTEERTKLMFKALYSKAEQLGTGLMLALSVFCLFSAFTALLLFRFYESFTVNQFIVAIIIDVLFYLALSIGIIMAYRRNVLQKARLA